MTFIHPWAIALGAVAAAAPVVIHLLTRPRPVRMPLSTLRFVREAIHARRARHRLRDAVILALRTLAVALLAVVIARPQWGEQPLISERQSGDAVRVVILDVSQSMAATIGSVEQIEQAKTVAANRYLRYRPGLWANLVLAGATPRTVFDGPSANIEALRDELAHARALPERLDVKAALERAARMLAPATDNDQRRRELVVLSDFQRANWAQADFAVLPEGTQIQLESTAPDEPPPNVAILRASAKAASSRAGSVQVEIEVGNFTPAAREITVEVVLADAARRQRGVCPAQGRITLVEEMEIHGTGWQSGQARLVGVDDVLAADNTRALVVQLRPKPTYALVTREPANRRPSSSYFLQCALVPDERLKEKSSAALLRVDPVGLDAKTLAPCDLICLDHPGKLSDEAIKLLSGLLRRGHPLLYVAGEAVNATNLKQLVEAAGSGLQMPVEFTPPPAGHVRRNLFLTSLRQDEAPFRVFGDDLKSIIGPLHFAGGLSSRRLDSGLGDDVLAAYNDGSACMVLTSSDAGVLAVINADLAASNLPQSSAFVPLVEELIERMLVRTGGNHAALCGERLVAQLPGEASPVAGLRIVGPESARGDVSGGRFGELIEEGAGAAWHWRSPDRPGAYQVERNGAALYALAVQIPAQESQLDSLSPEVLKTRLAAGHRVYYRSAASEAERRDDLWKWFAVACVICMLGEIASLLAFRT